jgi:ABC-type transport system involved in multi-copper enzyme maturation permease subunit
MPFANLALGFKLVWRNKRRFLVVMSGLILAISIIGALFLVANEQAREMGVDTLRGYERPISLSYGNTTINMTEYNGLDDLIFEADAIGTNAVEAIIHDLQVSPYNLTSFSIRYFFTKNQTLNWTTFVLNSSAYMNLVIHATDDFANSVSIGTGAWWGASPRHRRRS